MVRVNDQQYNHNKMAVLALALLAFSARASTADCPDKTHALQWVTQWVKADFEGARLSNEKAPSLPTCLSPDALSTGDALDLVRAYRIAPCKKKPGCFAVSYQRLGQVSPGQPAKLFAQPQNLTVQYTVRNQLDDGRWELLGTDEIAPQVGVKALTAYLQELGATEEKDSWIFGVLTQLKSVRP